MILATLVELSHCRLTQIKRYSTLLSNKIELKTFPRQLFSKCPHPRFNKRPFRNSTNSVNNQSSSVNITDKKTTKRKFMKLIFLDYTPRWRKECPASYFRSCHDAMMIIRAVFVSSHRSLWSKDVKLQAKMYWGSRNIHLIFCLCWGLCIFLIVDKNIAKPKALRTQALNALTKSTIWKIMQPILRFSRFGWLLWLGRFGLICFIW